MRCVHVFRAASNCIAHQSCYKCKAMRCSYYWDDVGRFVVQSVRQVLIEGNEMCNVDVAVVLLRQDIFPDLISVAPSAPPPPNCIAICLPVDIDAIEVKLQHKLDDVLLGLLVALLSILNAFAKEAEGVD